MMHELVGTLGVPCSILQIYLGVQSVVDDPLRCFLVAHITVNVKPMAEISTVRRPVTQGIC